MNVMSTVIKHWDKLTDAKIKSDSLTGQRRSVFKIKLAEEPYEGRF
jgi:hypothetical protein